MALTSNVAPFAEIIAIAISVFFFVLGSFYDFKTREVTDKLWVAYGSLGLVTTVVRLLAEPSAIFLTLISIAITTLLSFAMFYFGLFGGADSKAIICLGLTIPLPPAGFRPIIGYAHPIFPLDVVILGFICSAGVALWFATKNLFTYVKDGSRIFEGLEHESKGKKLIAALTGYPAEVSKLRSKFYLYPIEEVTQDLGEKRRSLKLFFSAETDRDQLVTGFMAALSHMGYQGRVWVTPGLPMLFFILIGLLIALLVGDPIFGSVLILASR